MLQAPYDLSGPFQKRCVMVGRAPGHQGNVPHFGSRMFKAIQTLSFLCEAETLRTVSKNNRPRMRNKQVEREKPGKVQRIGERGRLAFGGFCDFGDQHHGDPSD